MIFIRYQYIYCLLFDERKCSQKRILVGVRLVWTPITLSSTSGMITYSVHRNGVWHLLDSHITRVYHRSKHLHNQITVWLATAVICGKLWWNVDPINVIHRSNGLKVWLVLILSSVLFVFKPNEFWLRSPWNTNVLKNGS